MGRGKRGPRSSASRSRSSRTRCTACRSGWINARVPRARRRGGSACPARMYINASRPVRPNVRIAASLPAQYWLRHRHAARHILSASPAVPHLHRRHAAVHAAEQDGSCMPGFSSGLTRFSCYSRCIGRAPAPQVPLLHPQGRVRRGHRPPVEARGHPQAREQRVPPRDREPRDALPDGPGGQGPAADDPVRSGRLV